MGLFRKAGSRQPAHPVSAFWAWWADAHGAISPHKTSAATDRLTEFVTAIHPELTWHFGPGSSARHRLTVSAGGIAAARPSAERWYRAAPRADETWEFRPAQEAQPDALDGVLELAGQQVDLSAMRFRVDPVEEEIRVHVGIHHPLFSAMSKKARLRVSYLTLDWLLGEDDVERWLGHIEALPVLPASAVGGDVLREAVANMSAARDPQRWSLAQWTDRSGRPGVATFRRGLRWLDHPTFDRHQKITRSYAAQPNGLPADGETLDELATIEASLEQALGGRGVLVAYESVNGARTFHVYSDSEDQNVDDVLRTWAEGNTARLTSTLDPAWSDVRHFTG